MHAEIESAFELLTGRWRGQILHAGVKLGIVDQVAGGEQTADAVAAALSLNADNTYRLMRALASIGVLVETEGRVFSLTTLGEMFTRDHEQSLRGVCLWEEGELMYTLWRHLPDVVREGGPSGSMREYGQPTFERISGDQATAALFNDAMTSYSLNECEQIMAALDGLELSGTARICDIAGGQGYLLCRLLQKFTHATGTVLELPSTLAEPDKLLARPMGLADRCDYVAGDMFESVPAAEAYFLKYILHDWDDTDARRILEVAHRASGQHARIFLAENVVPGPEKPDFSKLFDIHMMVVLSGRERTEAEFADLLASAGWRHCKTWWQPEGTLAVVEGVKAGV